MTFHCIKFIPFCHLHHMMFYPELICFFAIQAMGWKHLLTCHGIYFLWCLWPGIWRTVSGTCSRNQLTRPSAGSHVCVCAADLQRSLWSVLCIRNLTLMHLSSAVGKFCRVCLKLLHSHFPEAFGNPWSSPSFASDPAIWDPPLPRWSILQQGGAKRIWLQTWAASSSLLQWGQIFKGKPAMAVNLGSCGGSSL